MEAVADVRREIDKYREVLPQMEASGFDFSQDWICRYALEKAKAYEGVNWLGAASFFAQLCKLDDHEPLFRVLLSDTESGRCFRQISPFLEIGLGLEMVSS